MNQAESDQTMNRISTAFYSKKRRPLIPVVIAYIAGIILDEYFRFPFKLWMTASICFLFLWQYLNRKHDSQNTILFLFMSILLLGAGHHHWTQFIISKNNLFSYASDDWKLVRLKGVISDPTIIKTETSKSFNAAHNFIQHKTTINLQVDSLVTNNGWIKVSGITQVKLKGKMESFLPGDMIEVSGWLTRIRSPQNPGEFDFQTWMRRKSIRTILFAEHPLAIRFQKKTNRFTFRRIITECRDYCEERLSQYLTLENQAIANALFLGDRSQISLETREILAESGLFHLISISGLHIGFLALMIHSFCRMMGIELYKTALIVISLLVLYALFTGARPPVIRATLVISCLFYALVWNRQAQTYNVLAFSILILLLFNPAVVFDTGAQLSYLAIIGLVEGSKQFHQWRQYKKKDKLKELIRNSSPILQLRHYISMRFLQISAMMAGIFFVNFPLIESKFHLITVSGFLINLLLMPVAGICICAGYLILLLILLFPFLASFPAEGMNAFLTTFLQQIRLLTDYSHGHIYSPGYPEWWVILFYFILLTTILSQFQIPLLKKAFPVFLLIWSCFGLTLIYQQDNNFGFKGTFLSVGHGTSVLLEFPNGKTILYDAGSLNSGRRASSVIESVLWKHGHSRIDAVIISHADIDHCNAIPYLMDRISIGSIVTTPTFLDFKQSIVKLICTKAHQLKIPLQLVTEKDQLRIDNDVSIQIIHPSNTIYESDNENSVVLLIEYHGKRILLPGDIEGKALNDLINKTEGNFDIFMTPHHGSLSANDPGTIAWASPSIAVSSGANERVNEKLKMQYGQKTQIYSTKKHGAISFTISPAGLVKIKANN
jgi:competence protein ComEC